MKLQKESEQQSSSIDVEKNISDMTDDELLKTYYFVSEKCASRPNVNDAMLFSSLAQIYSTELSRRETQKANLAIRRWTMLTGILTAIILAATVVNILLIS